MPRYFIHSTLSIFSLQAHWFSPTQSYKSWAVWRLEEFLQPKVTNLNNSTFRDKKLWSKNHLTLDMASSTLILAISQVCPFVITTVTFQELSVFHWIGEDPKLSLWNTKRCLQPKGATKELRTLDAVFKQALTVSKWPANSPDIYIGRILFFLSK